MATAVAAVLVVVAAVVIQGNGSATPSAPASDDVVAKVDGIAIPMREFALYLDQDRSAVVAFLQQRFGAQDGASFWTTRFAGKTASEWLEAAALADVTRTTVQFELASRYKLVLSPSYADFVTAWQTENERRAQAVANHQPIYGPQQYTESNYLSYVVGNLAYALQDKLAADGTFDTSDATLQAYYLKHASDFTTNQIGPAPINFEPVKLQVRLASLDAQYRALIDRRVASARVTTTADLARLVSSGCIAVGACS